MKRKAGEKEQFYLNVVKEYLAYEDSYGIGEVEFESMKSLIFSATPNVHSSDFPDFIIENGFIEHFEITSSYERNKGGSKIKEDEAHFYKIYEKELTDFIESEKNEQLNLKIFSRDLNLVGHSYDYLIKSLRRNIDSHIESIELYKGKKALSIFFIQYSDDVLHMRRISSDDTTQQHINYYRLSCDIDALKVIYEYKDKIEYVLFLGKQHIKNEAKRRRVTWYDTIPLVELIKVSEIEKLIEEIGEKYLIYPTINGRRMSTLIPTGSNS